MACALGLTDANAFGHGEVVIEPIRSTNQVEKLAAPSRGGE